MVDLALGHGIECELQDSLGGRQDANIGWQKGCMPSIPGLLFFTTLP